MMRAFAAVSRLRLTTGRRWVGDEGFTIFVMAPLVVGGAALIFEPFVADAARALRVGALPWIDDHRAGMAAAVGIALIVARLSGAIRDAFALRECDFALDALPISSLARAHDALLRRVAKALPVGIALVLAAALAVPDTGGRLSAARDAVGPALLLSVALGIVETGAAMLAVHGRFVRPMRLAVTALAVAAAAFAVESAVVVAVFVLPIVMYGVTLYAFAAWRIADRDVARQALARARRSRTGFEQRAGQWFGLRIAAQVVRDLRLVRRGFSSSVYAAAGLAVVVPGAATWLARSFALGPDGCFRAAGAATAAAAFVLSALTHGLVAYERPRVWIDLVCGVAPEEFPKARLWTARLLAAPALPLGLATAAATGVPLGIRTVATVAWSTWATASLTGVLCYELKERPAAGLALAAVLAGGVTLLVVVNEPFDLMWSFGLFAYVYAMFHLEARAKDKVG